MAILKRFICSKHGEFEAWSDEQEGLRCPKAKCRCKPREMVSAPAVHREGRTANIDKTVDQLAMDFKMTNIKSTREGENQSGYYTRNNAPAPKPEPRPGDAVMWGGGGRFNLDGIVKNGAARPVMGEQVGFSPKDAGIRRGPAVSSVIKDHENLKIE